MDNNNLGMKELYDVVIKATYEMKIGNRTIETGEPILAFDKILMSSFNEFKSHVAARGGWDNRAHVTWDTTKELSLKFAQGTFTQAQFALLSNSKLIESNGQTDCLTLPTTEEHETDENGRFELKETPLNYCFFMYNKSTGEKITEFNITGKVIGISTPYIDVIVHYYYSYNNGGSVIQIGQRLFPGYVKLEGRTRLKEDIDGRTTTGIIVIPKLKLMSDLSMRLGSQANPIVANFDAVGYPVGNRGQERVMEFAFLNDDIDSDI